MKNKVLMGGAALASLIGLGHFGAKPLLAQIRAALVKNVDEPGRSPYQSTVRCTVSPAANFCIIDMAPVPAGKRLVIQRLGARWSCTGSCNLDFILIVKKSGLTLEAAPIVPPANPAADHGAVNQEVLFYIEPGDAPQVLFGVPSAQSDVRVTITGYLVDLTQ